MSCFHERWSVHVDKVGKEEIEVLGLGSDFGLTGMVGMLLIHSLTILSAANGDLDATGTGLEVRLR